MALKTFKFGIGEGYQEISLPEEHILQVIEGNEVPKLDDVQAATIEALRNPINSKPLQEVVSKGEKVAVIVSDITRGWIRTPEFLKYVIDEINLGGVPDEDICIVIAQGTHRAQTREEDIAVCGKEVADRMKTGPGSKEYGALSLAVQYYANPEIVANVPPNCFMPRPNVGSAVIRLTRHETPVVDVKDEKQMFRIMRESFYERRKTLVNGLKNSGEINFSKEQIEPAITIIGKPLTIRGEALTLAEFAALSNAFSDM